MESYKNTYYYRAGTLMLIVVACFILASVVTSLFADDLTPTTMLLANGLFTSVLSILAPSVFFTGKAPQPEFNMHGISLKQGLASACVGIGLFFFATAINGMSDALFRLTGANTSVLSPTLPAISSVWVFLFCTALICILPAIAEEILFRGVLLYSWRKLGRLKVSALTGMLFALLHCSLPGLPALFVVGTLLGLVAYDSRSIYPGIIVHFVYNFIALSFLSLSSSKLSPEPSTLWMEAMLYGVFLLLGAVMLYMSFNALKRKSAQRFEQSDADGHTYGERLPPIHTPFPRATVCTAIAILAVTSIFAAFAMY